MGPIPPLPTLEDVLRQLGGLSGSTVVMAICLSALLMVAARDWRLVVAAFMVLYLGLAWLTAILLPPEWAVLRVIVGGLVALMWALSAQRAGWGGSFLPFQSLPGIAARPLSTTTLFRALLGLALAGGLLVVRPRLPLPSLPADLRLVITWLVAFALLNLAVGDEALQVGTGLLMWLGASQLLLSALRQDAWQVWLLSTVELLVGLATAYLMVARGPATQAGQDERTG